MGTRTSKQPAGSPPLVPVSPAGLARYSTVRVHPRCATCTDQKRRPRLLAALHQLIAPKADDGLSNISSRLLYSFRQQNNANYCPPLEALLNVRRSHRRSGSVSSSHSDASSPSQREILSVSGTGSYLWAVETAQQNEHVNITHVDTTKNKAAGLPANCTFVGKEVLSNQGVSFDYARVEFSLLFQPTENIPRLFKHLYQQLKPGGHIELFESDMLFQPETLLSPRVELLNLQIREQAEAQQIHLTALHRYAEWLYEAGFVEVAIRSVQVPVSNVEMLGQVWERWGHVGWRRARKEMHKGSVQVWALWAKKPIWSRPRPFYFDI